MHHFSLLLHHASWLKTTGIGIGAGIWFLTCVFVHLGACVCAANAVSTPKSGLSSRQASLSRRPSFRLNQYVDGGSGTTAFTPRNIGAALKAAPSAGVEGGGHSRDRGSSFGGSFGLASGVAAGDVIPGSGLSTGGWRAKRRSDGVVRCLAAEVVPAVREVSEVRALNLFWQGQVSFATRLAHWWWWWCVVAAVAESPARRCTFDASLARLPHCLRERSDSGGYCLLMGKSPPFVFLSRSSLSSQRGT